MPVRKRHNHPQGQAPVPVRKRHNHPQGQAPVPVPTQPSAGTGPRACPETTQPSAGTGLRACPETTQPSVGTGPRACPEQPQGVVPAMSLSDVIGRFKSFTTNRYIDGVKHHQWPPFDKILWQRSFYDHVIRKNEDLNRVREYIRNNPLKWALDKENPDNWAEG